MIDRVEGFGQIDGGANRSTRADPILTLIEALSDFRGERKQSSDTRSARGKAMLVRRARESEKREDKAFKNLRVRT